MTQAKIGLEKETLIKRTVLALAVTALAFGASVNAPKTPRSRPVAAAAPAAAEQLNFSIQDTFAGATLHVDWGITRASIPFTVG